MVYSGRKTWTETVQEVKEKKNGTADVRCGDNLYNLDTSKIDEHHFKLDSRVIFDVHENQLLNNEQKLIEVIGHEVIEKHPSMARSSEESI